MLDIIGKQYKMNAQCMLISIALICIFAGTSEGRTFKLGLMCPKSHLRLGWDITIAAALKGIEKAQKDGFLLDHTMQ